MLWDPPYIYSLERMDPLPRFGFDGLMLKDNYVGPRKVKTKVVAKSRARNKAARKARKGNRNG